MVICQKHCLSSPAHVSQIGLAQDAIGIAWASNFAGVLTTRVLERIHEFVTLVGYTFAALHAQKVAQTRVSVDEFRHKTSEQNQP